MGMAEKTNLQKRENSPYWQELRKDWPSAIAIYAVLLATIFMLISLFFLFKLNGPYPYFQLQFWVMFIVVSTWWSYLQKYGPKSVMLFRVMMLLIIPSMLIITFIAHIRESKDMGIFVSATVLCSTLIFVSIWFYRKSVLRKHGPFR